jgi:hypothetical protein
MTYNLEQELYDSRRICNKAAGQTEYCQNLYAALCNNEFQKLTVDAILSDEKWSCTWRYAGGIASKLFNKLKKQDYMEFYCFGIWHEIKNHYVTEGFVSEEIREDLLSINWVVIDNSNDEHV